MEPSVFFSPLVLTITGIIAAFMAVLVALDVRRSQHRKRLQGVINRYVANKARKSFSVIVELDRSAEAILPLLDHLLHTDYDNLHVVVVVRHTAGKRALNELRRYQRVNKGKLAMSVIKHKKGMDRQFILQRHAKSDLVLWLERDERLSTDFFRRISLEFLDTSLDAVATRQIAQLNDTLASASQGWNLMLRDIAASLKGKSTEPKVYRRTALLKDVVSSVGYVSHSSITVPSGQTHKRSDGLAGFGLLLLLGAVSLSAYLLMPRSWIFIVLAAVGASVLSLSLHLTSFQYSIWSKLTLFLFLPFWPIAGTFTLVIRKLAGRPRQSQASRKARIFTLW